MGYRAPSAEDIYSYVFRLDDYERSLTDGFGLSIIFVNDNSSVCQELISRYFVDLCHRTADRIRIIFFSDVPESYFKDMAEKMNNSNSDLAKNLRQNGMLNQVIEKQSCRNLTKSQLLDDLLKAIHLGAYGEVDYLLSNISRSFGPRYADALERLVCEHRSSPINIQDIEIQVQELTLEMKNHEWQSDDDRFRRMYYDHWRDLTPNSIKPIDAPERTHKLSFNTQNNAAMPGVGESMRFAARLGIGRHVPCFVFFSDIGSLSIDVFPIGNLSCDETYKQMRDWIDSFYEENCALIDKWSQVERDITTFTNSINQPIVNLKSWTREGEKLWSELRIVAEIIVKLSSSLSEPKDYKSVIENLNISSWRCEQILLHCKSSLDKLKIKKDEHKRQQEILSTIIIDLNAASNSTQVYDILSCALDKKLPHVVLNIIKHAKNLVRQKQHDKVILSLEHFLFVWWGLVQKKIPTFTKFKNAYKIWQSIAQQANEVITNEVVRFKYTEFLRNVFDLPFLDSTETLIKKTRFLLADIVDINSQSIELDIAFSEYFIQLTPFFDQLTYSPEWIVRDKLDTKISDVIPFQNRDRVNFGKILDKIEEDSPLNYMIQQQFGDNLIKRKLEIAIEIEKTGLKCRDETVILLINLQEESLNLSKEEISVYSNCLHEIGKIRNEIEKKLVDLANHSNMSPRSVENKDVTVFLHLLDEYEQTVNKFIYPYKGNRKVKNIKLRTSFPQIFELAIPKQKKNELKKYLEKAVYISKSGVTLLQDVQKLSHTITPSARLEHELSKALYENKKVTDNTEQVPMVQPAAEMVKKLYEFNDEQLQNVWNSLVSSAIGKRSRQEIINTLAAIVGLIPSIDQQQNWEYEAKIKAAENAIFRKHNADLLEVAKIQGSQPITIKLNMDDQKSQVPNQSSPMKSAWINGSFYVFIFVVVVGMIGFFAGKLPIQNLIIVVIASILVIPVIGSLQLLQDGNFSQENFMRLMKLLIAQLPLIGNILERFLELKEARKVKEVKKEEEVKNDSN